MVQSSIGFYEHWLYFHGPDHIYHEKYHENFVQIAESILAEERARNESRDDGPSAESEPKNKVPKHKYALKKPNLNKIKIKLIGRQADGPEANKEIATHHHRRA